MHTVDQRLGQVSYHDSFMTYFLILLNFYYVVFENQIEKFCTLYLENVIETVNRVVISGICTFK